MPKIEAKSERNLGLKIDGKWHNFTKEEWERMGLDKLQKGDEVDIIYNESKNKIVAITKVEDKVKAEEFKEEVDGHLPLIFRIETRKTALAFALESAKVLGFTTADKRIDPDELIRIARKYERFFLEVCRGRE